MEAQAFAAVVDGEIDIRTVSADADSAKRQALFWLFSMPAQPGLDEERAAFLWETSVKYLATREPARSLEIVPISLRVAVLS